MSKKGVIGAGTMGKGIAQILAQYNFEVVLVDSNPLALEDAKINIYNSLRMAGLFNKSFKNLSADEAIKRITFTSAYDLLEDVDFVIENIPEKIESKRIVYQNIDSICNRQAIFAVNTSCIPVTEIASFTTRKEQVVGMHFMNPVPMIAAVEVMKGYYTSKKTIDLAFGLLSQIQKEGILVNDSPGFVSNRISHLMMNEAARLVEENVASVEAIDAIFKKCYGHKMGPLETADLIGIDTVVDSLDILFDHYKDHKFACCTLLRKMVAAGETGRKSGKGFYGYEG